jgi:hypothetical protein
MRIVDRIIEGVIVFVIAFAVSAVVSGLWNLAAHDLFAIDWESSFRLGIILGIVTPLANSRRGRGK